MSNIASFNTTLATTKNAPLETIKEVPELTFSFPKFEGIKDANNTNITTDNQNKVKLQNSKTSNIEPVQVSYEPKNNTKLNNELISKYSSEIKVSLASLKVVSKVDSNSPEAKLVSNVENIMTNKLPRLGLDDQRNLLNKINTVLNAPNKNISQKNEEISAIFDKYVIETTTFSSLDKDSVDNDLKTLNKDLNGDLKNYVQKIENGGVLSRIEYKNIEAVIKNAMANGKISEKSLTIANRVLLQIEKSDNKFMESAKNIALAQDMLNMSEKALIAKISLYTKSNVPVEAALGKTLESLLDGIKNADTEASKRLKLLYMANMQSIMNDTTLTTEQQNEKITNEGKKYDFLISDLQKIGSDTNKSPKERFELISNKIKEYIGNNPLLKGVSVSDFSTTILNAVGNVYYAPNTSDKDGKGGTSDNQDYNLKKPDNSPVPLEESEKEVSNFSQKPVVRKTPDLNTNNKVNTNEPKNEPIEFNNSGTSEDLTKTAKRDIKTETHAKKAVLERKRDPNSYDRAIKAINTDVSEYITKSVSLCKTIDDDTAFRFKKTLPSGSKGMALTRNSKALGDSIRQSISKDIEKNKLGNEVLQENIDAQVEQAKKAEDLLNDVLATFPTSDDKLVTLLRKFRDIIVDLDFKTRDNNDIVNKKIQDALGSARKERDNKSRWEKLDEIKNEILRELKNSKETLGANLSSESKQILSALDGKNIGKVLLEFFTLKDS